MFKEDLNLLYDENGSMSELANALLVASHNAGIENIRSNYDAYKKDNQLWHLT